MTAQIFNLEELQAKSGSKSLVVTHDDFSVKVTSKVDQMFWVRVKKSDTGEVIVTDFNPGKLPQVTLNIALRKAVQELYSSEPTNLTFRNIISVESANTESASSYEGPVNAIRAACEGFARVSRKAISSFRVVPDGHKFNVVVALN